jgi:hypothetical protein
VLAVVSSKASQVSRPCFKFEQDGFCLRAGCPFEHKTDGRKGHRQHARRDTRKRRSRSASPRRRDDRDRSPKRRRNSASPARQSSTKLHDRYGGGTKRYTMKDRAQVPEGVCPHMYKTSSCRSPGCRLKHGSHATQGQNCVNASRGEFCKHLWSARGCSFAHESKNGPSR